MMRFERVREHKVADLFFIQKKKRVEKERQRYVLCTAKV
jgi:hypothetical protein